MIDFWQNAANKRFKEPIIFKIEKVNTNLVTLPTPQTIILLGS